MSSREILALGKDTEFATHLLVVNKSDILADNRTYISTKSRVEISGTVYEIKSCLTFDKQWQLHLRAIT